MMFLCIILAILVLYSNAFYLSSIKSSHRFSLQMSDASDPLGPIRAKMAADPNYNPMADPQAMSVIESLIPAEMREFPNSMERVKVAFKDATSGADSVTNLDSTAETFANKQELISSPQSQWFKSGMPNSDYSKDKADELLKKLKSEFPDVPSE